MRELLFWAIGIVVLVALWAGLLIWMAYTLPPVPPGEAPGPGDGFQFLLHILLLLFLTGLFGLAVVVRLLFLFVYLIARVFVGKPTANSN
jgi:hypothetical protein